MAQDRRAKTSVATLVLNRILLDSMLYDSTDSIEAEKLDTVEPNFAESAAPYVAEFVGTYLLVFAIAVNSILSESWGPTAVGSLLAVLVYIFGPVSGAYFNPAVSVAAGLTGQISWRTVMAYTVLQITAGFIAGIACYEVFQMRMGVAPTEPFHLGEAAFLEVLFTTMLVFVVLSVTASRTWEDPMPPKSHGESVRVTLISNAAALHRLAAEQRKNMMHREKTRKTQIHTPLEQKQKNSRIWDHLGFKAAVALIHIPRHETTNSESAVTFCLSLPFFQDEQPLQQPKQLLGSCHWSGAGCQWSRSWWHLRKHFESSSVHCLGSGWS